jgi:cell division protein FtsL
MTRVNLVLLLLLVACGLALVSSQHHARKLFVELQREQARAQNLEIEFGRLQLEQSTWATHSRVERIAASDLQMSIPPAERLRILPPPPAPSNP